MFWVALASLLVASGPIIGGMADRWWTSALLLHMEPLLLVWATLTAWLLSFRGRIGMALLLLCGATGAAAGSRYPMQFPDPPAPDPILPGWLATVSECGRGVVSPLDEVRLLTWRVTSPMELAELYRISLQYRPDILVVRGLTRGAVLERIRADLGAEYQSWPERDADADSIEEPVVVLTRGVFHQCGSGETAWSYDSHLGPRHFMFVGITPETTVPLLVTSYPGPWGELDQRRVQDAAAIDAWTLERIGAGGALVVADAPSPRYQHLDRWFSRIHLRSTPTLPTWPMAFGPLPLFPVHAYDRVWMSREWKIEAWERLDVHLGGRAPLVGILQPAEASGR